MADLYRRFPHVYSRVGMPDIIVPWTNRIDGYAMIVSDLIKVFAVQSDCEESVVYYDLTVADRDLIRVGGTVGDKISLPMGSVVSLLNGSRDMILASAGSLDGHTPYIALARTTRRMST